MTVTLNRWVALVGLVTAIGCAGKTGSIQGSATYRERMALPSTAVFEALLEDVSRADAAAETLARTRVPSPGNPPIAFTLEYDPARVRAGRRYVVRGRVLVDGQLLFTTDTAVPVMPGEDATPVSLLLRRVGSGQVTGEQLEPFDTSGSQSAISSAATQSAGGAGASPLAGTAWQLVRFEGSDDTTLVPDDRSKYAIELAADGGLIARIDCNRGRGTWLSTGASEITFGPMALTRAQCAPGSLHDHLVKQLPNIRSFVIRDGHLFLALMADGGIYEFEPISRAVR